MGTWTGEVRKRLMEPELAAGRASVENAQEWGVLLIYSSHKQKLPLEMVRRTLVNQLSSPGNGPD